MIAHLTGTVLTSDPLVLDVNGVGYQVFVPSRISRSLKPGQSLSVHTHTHVREDALDLFGFQSAQDLFIFNLLITVSGVGPKTALSVLDHDASSIRHAIEKGDVDFFTSVPRLGRKNAQKIIIELRSKLTGLTGDLPQGNETGELMDALISMGFDRKEIRTIINKIPLEGSIEERLKLALKLL